MTAVDNPGGALPRTAITPMMRRNASPPGPVCSVAQDAPEYPQRLLRLQRPPARVWHVGRLPAPGERAVALVGARAATAGACERASALAGELGRRGFAIVSGGAFGIDAAAHEGALSVGACTYAVLGCGVDVVYPDRHGPLFRRIAAGGGLLSEYEPGTAPRAGQFPARNRLIAALAGAVVVVEAAARSGALITAGHARWLGVPVLAVPGSVGTDNLLRKGRAWAAASADDVVAALEGAVAPLAAPAPEAPPPGPLGALLMALADGSDSVAGLARRLEAPISEVMSLLSEAELDGRVRRLGGGHYEVILAH
jgi:DNA processing protein